ncbi:hypothetical protein TYRP_010409 [Tyrophagus putrescentiae]|nr:hypothetical protein TYRP_010409 [Tyrophagus putrescentiae]
MAPFAMTIGKNDEDLNLVKIKPIAKLQCKISINNKKTRSKAHIIVQPPGPFINEERGGAPLGQSVSFAGQIFSRRIFDSWFFRYRQLSALPFTFFG